MILFCHILAHSCPLFLSYVYQHMTKIGRIHKNTHCVLSTKNETLMMKSMKKSNIKNLKRNFQLWIVS